jgi:hypothetical protein
MNGDVMMLKRLFQYQAHNKLLPALQVRTGGMPRFFLAIATQVVHISNALGPDPPGVPVPVGRLRWLCLFCCFRVSICKLLLALRHCRLLHVYCWKPAFGSAVNLALAAAATLPAFLIAQRRRDGQCRRCWQPHAETCPAAAAAATLQTLLTETGEEMADAKDDGSPMPLAHYNVGNNSAIILRIMVSSCCCSQSVLPMVDEVLSSSL